MAFEKKQASSFDILNNYDVEEEFHDFESYELPEFKPEYRKEI